MSRKYEQTASSKIAHELERATGIKGRRIKVKMKGTRDLAHFLKTFRDAEEHTRKHPSTERYAIA